MTTPAAPFHLSHTGPLAGQPICNARRVGNEQHPAYNDQALARQLETCCPNCRDAWNDVPGASSR